MRVRTAVCRVLGGIEPLMPGTFESAAVTRDTTRRCLLASVATAAGATPAVGTTGAAARTAGEQVDEVEWERTLDSPGTPARISDVVAVGDGAAIAVGDVATERGDEAWAVRIEADGSTTWSETYRPSGDATYSQFRGAASTGDGGVVAAGTGAEVERDGDGRTAGWIARLGSDGTLQWRLRAAGSGPTRFADVAWDADGAAAAGEVDVQNRRSDPFVLAVDGAGDERWRAEVGEPDGNEAIRAIAAGPAGYCAVGDAADRPNFQGRQGYAVCFDADGERRWRTRVGTEDDREFYGAAPRGPDGFVLAGSRESGDAFSSRALLLGIDGDGEVAWERSYDDGAGIDFLRSVRRLDDAVVATGSRSAEGDDRSVWLIGATTDGDAWFERSLGAGDDHQQGRGVAVLGDGRALVGGTMLPDETESPYAALASLPDQSAAGGDAEGDTLPGFGTGAAIAGLGIGGGLLATRRRSE